MNTKRMTEIQQTLIRSVAASILSCPLSREELIVGIDAMDDAFIARLQAIIRLAVAENKRFGEEPLAAQARLPSTNERVAAELIYEAVKQRRMAKDRLLRHIEAVSKTTASLLREEDLPAKEMISLFVQTESATAIDQLLARISGGTEQDPFLAGIANR